MNQALSDMERTEDSLNLRTLLALWGWNTTSVLDLTVTSVHSEAEEVPPSLRISRGAYRTWSFEWAAFGGEKTQSSIRPKTLNVYDK